MAAFIAAVLVSSTISAPMFVAKQQPASEISTCGACVLAGMLKHR